LMTDEQINGSEKEEVDPRWGISGREIQQLFGTELMREYLPSIHEGFRTTTSSDIWCRRFKMWYEALPVELDVVISDVRFLNEATIINQLGGKIVRLERKGLVSNDTHASEMEMEMIYANRTLYNDGTIAELEMSVGVLYRDLTFNG